MSFITYPLNNIEYTAEDAELFHVTRTSGVYANDSFPYTVSGENNIVEIGKGIGWIKNGEFAGKVIAQKTTESIDLGVADSNFPRIDSIVIQFNATNNETSLIVKKGTASSEPTAPEVTRTSNVFELHLYHVKRLAGATSITANDITDLRTNETYCGIMLDSVTQNTISSLGAVPITRTINGKPLSADVVLDVDDISGAVPDKRTVNGMSLEADITLTAENVNAVPKTRTVNGKSLTSDISLDASDVGAVSNARKINGKALTADVTLTATDVNALNAKKGTALANIDMDDVKTPGTYSIESSNVASSIKNLPYQNGASIVDVRNGGYSSLIVQTQYAIDSANVPVFSRRWNGDVWSSWVGVVRSINNVSPTSTSGGNITLEAEDVGAVPKTRKINNHALTSDITLTATELECVPKTRTVNGKELSSNITLKATDFDRIETVGVTWLSNVDSSDSVTSSTIRYNLFAGVCFGRIAAKTSVDFNAGYSYNIATIDTSYQPGYTHSLSAYSTKQCSAYVSGESGIISVRAHEKIAKDSTIYITGWWFF